MLNLARAVQGTGGAMMFATSLALIAQAFHGQGARHRLRRLRRGHGRARWRSGPLLGGVITSGIGWEWIFFVNVPIGAIAVFITLTQVAESRDPNATGVDWAGLVTFSGSLFLLVLRARPGQRKGLGLDARSSPSSRVALVLLVAVRDRRAPAERARCST